MTEGQTASSSTEVLRGRLNKRLRADSDDASVGSPWREAAEDIERAETLAVEEREEEDRKGFTSISAFREFAAKPRRSRGVGLSRRSSSPSFSSGGASPATGADSGLPRGTPTGFSPAESLDSVLSRFAFRRVRPAGLKRSRTPTTPTVAAVAALVDTQPESPTEDKDLEDQGERGEEQSTAK
eukprot:CAMPEP_0175940112 /NCGR_PEP_ID=MMETSP0108-20121206/23619_1 /TAXON_ID=195067 ORGANISM="Goniomonas pacifica, Strain CCMP1869" /NCGR_SAMPLE_ID=MMETSP0108 /ASSEMBLY_ACC=CAM_ASM_000204 /LENGTH=182 /DNA_ID=CAMNT_0017264535 /DNA_START=49 /DNA_END=597 /DNA_ORIENTATION=-